MPRIRSPSVTAASPWIPVAGGTCRGRRAPVAGATAPAFVERAGADKVGVNTPAVARPQLVAELSTEFGAQCVVVAIDSNRAGGGFEVYTHGGRTPTGRDAVAWVAECQRLGAGEILLTSMDRDCMRDGFDLQLTRQVVDTCDIPVIASGGVGTLDHLVDGVRLGGAGLVRGLRGRQRGHRRTATADHGTARRRRRVPDGAPPRAPAPGRPRDATVEVRNDGPAGVTLVLPSGQRADVVLRQGSVEHYRWSRGRAFTQELGELRLGPGEARSFDLRDQRFDVPPGEYQLVASSASQAAPGPARRHVEVVA